MAYETLSSSDLISRNVNADLSTNQYYGVKISTTKAALCSVAGEGHLGVLQNKPAADGRAGSIAKSGISKLFAGGTIAAGDPLTMSAAGKYVLGYGADRLNAIALSAASASDIVEGIVCDGFGFCQHGPTERSFTFDLNNITAAADDLVTLSLADFVKGGRIKRVSAVVTKPVTTGSKAATLTVKLNTTALTGGVLALTSANCTPIGTEVAGTAVTALNTFVSTDTLTVTSSSVTQFSEGQISLKIEFA